MESVEMKSLNRVEFLYPDKSGELASRDVLVLNQDDEDLYTISLHGLEEEFKNKLLDTCKELNTMIEQNFKTNFRRFKKAKIILKNSKQES